MRRAALRRTIVLALVALAPRVAPAQTTRPPIDRGPPDLLDVTPDADAGDRYEIEVYGAATVAPGRWMLELHSNYVADGFTYSVDGTIPDEHALHETLELTRGLTDWAELGGYVFTSQSPGRGWSAAGYSVRPRLRVPERWAWPVGVSLSQEVAWFKSEYSANAWTYELRPIIDKQIERWYLALNPTLERALRGPDASKGFILSPSADLGFDVTAAVNLSLEYYASLGRLAHPLPPVSREQQLFYAVNLNLSPRYELNAGYGRGLDRAAEKSMIKLILGRRL
ncbi:MAG TPA: hypothetical protein VMH39_06690 [Gemmatimonadaceae bacterium]|nr:hypothetical protein [Gemmatimonadaceae bacterium]